MVSVLISNPDLKINKKSTTFNPEMKSWGAGFKNRDNCEMLEIK